MTKQYQTKHVVTKAQVLEASLNLLSDSDRRSIREDAQTLMLTVRSRGQGQRIMFGEAMAYELLYALGSFMNEEFPEE